MTIKTNNVPRDIIYGYELTEEESKPFDYIDWERARQGLENPWFFRYRGWLYDMGEFERVTDNQPSLKGWDGFCTESAFSAVLIRYVDNYERVVVGYYYH